MGLDDSVQAVPSAIGPFRITRPLPAIELAVRWLSVHEVERTTHVLYEMPAVFDRTERRRVMAEYEAQAGLKHGHILPIQGVTLTSPGRAWLVAPYTGTHDGLTTLSDLAAAKGGRFTPAETDRALAQLLSASAYAHDEAVRCHGPVAGTDVLVDRHGSLHVELYGLRARLAGRAEPTPDRVGDEVRAIIELGYTLLTGLPADGPRIAPGKLIRRLDRRWDDFFEAGLSPVGGFAGAAEAAAMLPSAARDADARAGIVRVRTVLGRVRSALRTS